MNRDEFFFACNLSGSRNLVFTLIIVNRCAPEEILFIYLFFATRLLQLLHTKMNQMGYNLLQAHISKQGMLFGQKYKMKY